MPPGQPTHGGTTPSGASFSNFDADHAKNAFRSAHTFDLGIIAAGVLAFLFSMFPYYKASVTSSGDLGGLPGFTGFSESGTWSAWHGFFGWFAAVLALGVAVMLALRLVGVLNVEASLARLVVLVGFGVATVCALLTFVVNPLPGEEASESVAGVTIEYSKGHAWGFWLSLLVLIAGLVLSFLRKDAHD
jgi:hypothetical protein